MRKQVIERLEQIENHLLQIQSQIESPVSKKIYFSELGIGKSTLDRWIAQGLPINRVNGKVLIYRSQANEWIRQQKKG